MGKNRNNRNKRQAAKSAPEMAESTSAVSSSSDAVRQSPRITSPFEVEIPEAAATRAPAPESGTNQSNEGVETRKPVTQNKTVRGGTERPNLEKRVTERTNESFTSAPSGEQDEDADTQNTGSFSPPVQGSNSDEAAAFEDAGAGLQPPPTEVHSVGENQPDSQAENKLAPRGGLVEKVWWTILEDALSHGINVEGIQASKQEPWTTLPSQPAREAKDEIADWGVAAGAQSLSGETFSDTLVAVDLEAPPQDVEKHQGKRPSYEPDEDGEASLSSLKQFVPDDESKTDDHQREITQSMLEHMQRQERVPGSSGLDAAERGEKHAEEDETCLREAGDQIDEHEIDADGLPDTEQTVLAGLQKKLDIERRKNKELVLQFNTALNTPARLDPESLVQTSRGVVEDLETMGVRPEIGRGGADDLTVSPDGERSPVTVFDLKYRTAWDLLSQKSHVLEQDTQFFKTIASVANYIDGVGGMPSKDDLRKFEEFRHYTTQRARLLEEALHGEDPMTTLEKFNECWPEAVENNTFGSRLDLRLATIRAAIYFKHSKDSPQYSHATMLLQQDLSRLRRRVGEDSEDPIALQMEDILNTVVQR